MSQATRHIEIARAIAEAIASGVPDVALYGDIRIESHPLTTQPERGIIVSPAGEADTSGTNESDDITYTTLVARVAGGLGNDEILHNSNWRTSIRLLFHRKRLNIPARVLYCTVRFGDIAIPRAWETFNLDKSALEIKCIVRESRTRT